MRSLLVGPPPVGKLLSLSAVRILIIPASNEQAALLLTRSVQTERFLDDVLQQWHMLQLGGRQRPESNAGVGESGLPVSGIFCVWGPERTGSTHLEAISARTCTTICGAQASSQNAQARVIAPGSYRMESTLCLSLGQSFSLTLPPSKIAINWSIMHRDLEISAELNGNLRSESKDTYLATKVLGEQRAK